VEWDFRPRSRRERRFSNRSPRLHQSWLYTYSYLHFELIRATDLGFMNGELGT